MARVRYTGWTDREVSRKGHRITALPKIQQRSIEAPNGERYVFRGRTGRPSQWRTVDSREALSFFSDHEDFEVEP